MLKILHVIQGCGGGVASLVGNLVRSADKTAVHQDVMSFSYENGERFVEELEASGARTYLLPRPRGEGLRAFHDYAVKIMKREKYDVVHCHSDGWRTILYRGLAKEAGVPLFCIHAHRAANDPGFLGRNGAFIRINQLISRKNADIAFACGEAAAKFIYGDARDSVTIPNGISLPRCRAAAKTNREALRTGLELAPGEIVILQAGRLVTQKNHGFTVELARELGKREIPFKMLLVGTGALEPIIREQLERNGLTDRVKLLGRRDDVYELMAMADVMILPSLYEGLPTVAIEAQAMGLYSLVADTVTQECDLGLGLVRFLPIDEGAACWADAVAGCREVKCPQSQHIERVVQESAYTDEGAVQRYISALNRAIAKK